MRISLGTSIQLGIIAMGLSLAAIAVTNGLGGFQSADPAMQYIKAKCQEKSFNGGHRELVYIGDQSWFKPNDSMVGRFGYTTCPIK